MERPDRSHVVRERRVHPGGCANCDRLWEIIEALTKQLLGEDWT